MTPVRATRSACHASACETPHLFGITVLLGDVGGDAREGLWFARGTALQGAAGGDPGDGGVGAQDAIFDAGVTAGLEGSFESLVDEVPVVRVDHCQESFKGDGLVLGEAEESAGLGGEPEDIGCEVEAPQPGAGSFGGQAETVTRSREGGVQPAAGG